MSLSTDVLKLAREAGRDLAVRARQGLDSTDAVTVARDAGTIDHARQSAEARRSFDIVRAAASASFVKELAKICGKAGAAGAAVDGAIGGFRAAQYVRRGAIDTEQAVKHVGAEAGCGFVTSSSGTAGTLAVFMVTGSMGPAALAAGMGASMGSRYLYKQAVGETLPTEEELDEMERNAGPGRSADGSDPERAADPPSSPDLRDIGPNSDDSDGGADMESIGPEGDASSEPPEGTDGRVGDSSARDDDESDDSDGPNGGDVWEQIGPQ